MELDVRGTPAWQLREYLTQLGGPEQPDGVHAGPDWRATLTVGEHAVLHTMVPRVMIRIEGEPVAVADVYAKLRLRVIRVGG